MAECDVTIKNNLLVQMLIAVGGDKVDVMERTGPDFTPSAWSTAVHLDDAEPESRILRAKGMIEITVNYM